MREEVVSEARRRMTTKQLAHKVGWEGGVLETIEYGIDSDDIEDPEVQALWAKCQTLYSLMRPLMSDLDLLLRSARAEPKPARCDPSRAIHVDPHTPETGCVAR